MWQIVANLEFVTGFAIDLQTRKPNISPRVTRENSEPALFLSLFLFQVFWSGNYNDLL